MARLVHQLVMALREKPSRFGYVLGILVLTASYLRWRTCCQRPTT
jgi:hypothetical protein